MDIWGAVRRSVAASTATAQADFALLENARLSYQAELAQDYFELHDTDGDIDLLQTTVKSYEDYLTLTQNRFKSGIASGADVAQAQTQVETTRAQLIDLEAARAQYEHAVAVLSGKPPAAVTVPAAVLKTPPPAVPVAVPSALLERRPDIAAVRAANGRGLRADRHCDRGLLSCAQSERSCGLRSGYRLALWPSRFFTLGGALSETVFEGGKRRAQVTENRALFDSTVANYRQTVLTAFQQVEDNLAALRVYEHEAAAVERAVKAADEALRISTYQYKAGTVAYLQVITSQAALLAEQRVAVDLLAKRMIASVLLVEALGGGWDSTSMPTAGRCCMANDRRGSNDRSQGESQGCGSRGVGPSLDFFERYR